MGLGSTAQCSQCGNALGRIMKPLTISAIVVVLTAAELATSVLGLMLAMVYATPVQLMVVLYAGGEG